MLKLFVEEAAALMSVALFVGMVAVWAQVIPQLWASMIPQNLPSDVIPGGNGYLGKIMPSPKILIPGDVLGTSRPGGLREGRGVDRDGLRPHHWPMSRCRSAAD